MTQDVNLGSWVQEIAFFRFWQTAQSRIARWPATSRWLLLLPFVVVGVALRVWAQTRPSNYDFASYLIVSDTVLGGQNPYETGRYNYGPVWFLLISVIRVVASEPEAFRLLLALVLTAADLALAYLLVRKGYALGACLFLLSPVAIAITGQHQQFDNLAVLLAVAAALMVTRTGSSDILPRDWAAIALLAASLTTKHVFIVLPIWLAIQQSGWKRKSAYLLVPPAVFALSLLPFMALNPSPVMKNVIQYNSFNNVPFLKALLPDQIAVQMAGRGLAVPLFLAIMVALGFLFRRVHGIELAFVYSVSLVVFTSAVTDQYLAIPMAGAAAFLNIGFAVWLLWASIYLAGNPDTLAVPIFTELRPYTLLTAEQAYQDLFMPLAIGWILMAWWLTRKAKESSVS